MDKLAYIDSLHFNFPAPAPVVVQPPTTEPIHSDPIPTPVSDPYRAVHYLSAADNWLLYDTHVVELYSPTNGHWYHNYKGSFDNSQPWLDYVQTWDGDFHI